MDCHATTHGSIPGWDVLKPNFTSFARVVNGGAVSKCPDCRWNVKHNQPTNQPTKNANDNVATQRTQCNDLIPTTFLHLSKVKFGLVGYRFTYVSTVVLTVALQISTQDYDSFHTPS